jgi:hypothetical protein
MGATSDLLVDTRTELLELSIRPSTVSLFGDANIVAG